MKARRDPPILDLHALFIRQIFILFPVNGLRIVGKNAFIQLTLVNPDQLFWPSIDEISVWGMTLRAGLKTPPRTITVTRCDLPCSAVSYEEEEHRGIEYDLVQINTYYRLKIIFQLTLYIQRPSKF